MDVTPAAFILAMIVDRDAAAKSAPTRTDVRCLAERLARTMTATIC